MSKDVNSWVRHCSRCLRFKGKPIRAPLVGILTTEPLELVCTDFLKVDASPNGTQYILVITDHFTKFALAVPTRNILAKTTDEALLTFVRHLAFRNTCTLTKVQILNLSSGNSSSSRGRSGCSSSRTRRSSNCISSSNCIVVVEVVVVVVVAAAAVVVVAASVVIVVIVVVVVLVVVVVVAVVVVITETALRTIESVLPHCDVRSAAYTTPSHIILTPGRPDLALTIMPDTRRISY
ncbi:Pol polyprotein [Elysia marginata]|uniref:Pol polyprotein n=1 Tax=Elysia marginata TaxID=1093978 RepID=A0AAV4G9E3_9GAST|nr:Pol polyprotein [Elysia marginata]